MALKEFLQHSTESRGAIRQASKQASKLKRGLRRELKRGLKKGLRREVKRGLRRELKRESSRESNKHCEILVSCSHKERNCIQAHVTACKIMKLHVSSCNFM